MRLAVLAAALAAAKRCEAFATDVEALRTTATPA
jgi:hypothetical protein